MNEKIKQLTEKYGPRQANIAKALGVTTRTYMNYRDREVLPRRVEILVDLLLERGNGKSRVPSDARRNRGRVEAAGQHVPPLEGTLS